MDTFKLGDTLWIHASIDKNVVVRNSSRHIYLENFTFFTKFLISEISDSFEITNLNFHTFELIGEIDNLTLPTGIVYPIHYFESNNKYEFYGGVVLETSGLFYTRFSTSSSIFEYYDHPAIYECDNNRRSNIRVYYSNQSTSLSNYENLFLTTKVDYLLELIDYQRYKDFGGHTFYVKP